MCIRDRLYSLFVGGGIAHTVFTLALVITGGILLGKVKVFGISLGVTWILFVGIIAAHFGMGIPGEVRHFIQEFGLILFVFSIGMQVGPGFFSSFKHGGLTMVILASTIVLLGVATAYVIHLAVSYTHLIFRIRCFLSFISVPSTRRSTRF